MVSVSDGKLEYEDIIQNNLYEIVLENITHRLITSFQLLSTDKFLWICVFTIVFIILALVTILCMLKGNNIKKFLSFKKLREKQNRIDVLYDSSSSEEEEENYYSDD